MKQYLVLESSNRNLWINKSNISHIDHWEDKKGIHRILIYLISKEQGIFVPVDQSQRVLEEMEEYWTS